MDISLIDWCNSNCYVLHEGCCLGGKIFPNFDACERTCSMMLHYSQPEMIAIAVLQIARRATIAMVIIGVGAGHGQCWWVCKRSPHQCVNNLVLQNVVITAASNNILDEPFAAMRNPPVAWIEHLFVCRISTKNQKCSDKQYIKHVFSTTLSLPCILCPWINQLKQSLICPFYVNPLPFLHA